MLLKVEIGIRGEIRHAIHLYFKANNKYMIMIKIMNHRILNIGI